jgi:site-specific DNA-methyltransferase (adenine-specific)
MFSSKSDEWSTPQDCWDLLDLEFQFVADMAASRDNSKCPIYWSESHSALTAARWPTVGPVWCNPPYSRGLSKLFISKAAAERLNGVTTVMLLPARTDTKAFHAHIWDAAAHRPRPGVEVRFLPGRLKFGGCKDPAPFPSMVVVFRP